MTAMSAHASASLLTPVGGPDIQYTTATPYLLLLQGLTAKLKKIEVRY